MKKGFTLIELLAVIVILAIIALIAIPIVLSIISDSKESASLRSSEMYLKGLETSIAVSTLDNKVVKDGTYSIIKNGNICLEYKDNKCTNELKVEMNGEKPTSGKVTISNGQVIDLILNYENKAIVKSNNKLVYSYKQQENIEVPDLYNGTLTPVIYDGENWKVANQKEKWYDYGKQEWANAVILNSDSTKQVGDTLVVDGESPDILGMYVWIPRYEYKIEGTYGKGGTSTESPGEIEVNFISTNKEKASDNYIIHPAFNFGGTELNGIWVGKFEIGHATKTENMSCVNQICEDANNIRVLPNKSSLRTTVVSSFFYGIRSMSMENNVFGIKKEITDTHMMKNSEWGAVAYLSQSKYGKYGNSDYKERNKEVYLNNSSEYITGRSGGSYGGNTAINTVYPSENPTATYQYNLSGYYTYDGYLLGYGTGVETKPSNMKKTSSTTGNIYGIYDMSGGAWEYVMGAFANSDGIIWSGETLEKNSGFKGKVGPDGVDKEGLEWLSEKYYDVYKAHTETTISPDTACNGGICYGHALTETTNWYGDYLEFIYAGDSWILRGGAVSNESSAGIFASYHSSGKASAFSTSRVVFTPST